MSNSIRTRGRPRGSGIDDTRTIQQILELLDRDPDLKPTTAIRALGIENESVIRRLRDKLKSMREQTLTPTQPQSQATPSQVGAPSDQAAQPAASITAPLNVQSDPIKRGPAHPTLAETNEQPVRGREKVQVETQPEPPEPLDPLARLPFAMFAATVSASQFFAIQNTLLFQAGMREAAKTWKPRVHAHTCPTCGQTLN
jgi:hypothetical protein